MTVKLIKQKQQNVSEEKQPEQPTTNDLLIKTQSWVKEFKQRKANTSAALIAALKNA